MRPETIVEGNLWIDNEIRRGCVGISDGKIVAIKRILPGDHYHDFGEKLIMPGVIDSHVHFRDPGRTHKEDFSTGTLSAAFGGVTCVMDMPNTIPPVTTLAALEEKVDVIKRKAHIDYGLYAAVTPQTEFATLSPRCCGFKLYMADPLFEAGWLDCLPRVGEVGGLAVVHAEDRRSFKPLHGEDLGAYLRARPNRCEREAIAQVVARGGRVHISHVSAAESIPLLRRTNASSEVTPHHLLLNARYPSIRGKVNPPLRTTADQTALWSALNGGVIDIIASDHAPHLVEEKDRPLQEAEAGIPGVETMLPLMAAMVRRDRLPLSLLIRTLCERPAEIFGLKNEKGKIAAGFDADLIALDLGEEGRIDAEKLHSKCGWTPYDGFPSVFPLATMVRGRFVVEDGEAVGDPGYGKWITPKKV